MHDRCIFIHRSCLNRGADVNEKPWTHKGSGLQLPRGSVVVSKPQSEEEKNALIVEVEAASLRRGVREAVQAVRRGGSEESSRSELQELVEWLARHDLDIIGSVTFTDIYAKANGVYSLERAVKDVRRGLAKCYMHKGRRVGFPGRFVLCGEWHPSGRVVPHVHLALESGSFPIENVCRELWTYFFITRGRSRFEPMRDVQVASLYGLKDTVKSNRKDAAVTYMKLQRHRR